MTNSREKFDIYAMITEQVIAGLERGEVAWHQPWKGGEYRAHKNLVSGKAYRGINVFLLQLSAMDAGYESEYWLTYKQAEAKGGNVRKGEKSTIITFWKRYEDKRGEPNKDGNYPTRAMLRYYRVFNVEQCDGIEYPKHDDGEKVDWEPIKECEAIVSNYLRRGPRYVIGGGSAYYSPSRDEIHMPAVETFESVERFYSTIFHEMTHSTGHKSRLARENLLEFHRFGDENYSKEELTAEMGAAMLCGVTGIEPFTLGGSIGYIQHWIKVLKGDSRMVVSAAALAQKAADLIRGVEYGAEEADNEEEE